MVVLVRTIYFSVYSLTSEAKPDETGFLVPVEFVHHNSEALEGVLKTLSVEYPNITRLYTIGKSVQERPLYVLEITDHPGIHEPGLLNLVMMTPKSGIFNK